MDRKTVRRYIERGLEPPTFGPRPPQPRSTDPFLPNLRERLAAYPDLTAVRLWRELRERGYAGGYTAVKRTVREIRPQPIKPFEVRFETPPGEQAQVDLARFEVAFTDEPGVTRIVWPFALDLGSFRRSPGSADRAPLPHCRARSDWWGAARDPLRPDEDRGDRRGMPTVSWFTTAASSTLPGITASSPKPAGLTGPRPRARSSGRSAIFARTSSSAVRSATSMISTLNSGIGSTRSPIPVSTRPRSASSTKPSPGKSHISNRCRSRPTERFSSSNGASRTRAW